MENLIEIKHLTKRYGEKSVLTDVNLTVRAGELIALLGENGAGKSTLINMINGLARPTSGEIKLGLSAQQIGLMLQGNIVLERLTVAEILQLARSYYAQPLSYAELLRLADLAEQEKKLMTELSGGQKRRLTFALALAGNPRLVFLDEPTTGMDAERRAAFWLEITRLQAAGKTFFITSHYLEELENLATRLILLADQSVKFDGSLAELRASQAAAEISFHYAGEFLSNLTEVLTQKLTGQFYRLTTNDVNAVIKQLVPLFDRGLSNLTVQQNSLDSLFSTLIKGEKS